jgi:hypothetical protein
VGPGVGGLEKCGPVDHVADPELAHLGNWISGFRCHGLLPQQQIL